VYNARQAKTHLQQNIIKNVKKVIFMFIQSPTPEIPFENSPFYVQVIILSIVGGAIILFLFALAWKGYGEDEENVDSSAETKPKN
jgi:polyferredoxin